MDIAKRLPLPALVKFARANAHTYVAARRVCGTWKRGCVELHIARMSTDKCWMDAYTRGVRQRAFRFVNGARAWKKPKPLPTWLQTALHAHLSAFESSCIFTAHVRKDYSVLNVVVQRRGDRMPWATLSSTGDVWQYADDHFPVTWLGSCLNLARVLFAKKMSGRPSPTPPLKATAFAKRLQTPDPVFLRGCSSV
jgi:hypothetical protein